MFLCFDMLSLVHDVSECVVIFGAVLSLCPCLSLEYLGQAQAGKMDVILYYLVAGALREMTLPTEWPKHNHMASHMWALCAPLAGCGAHGKLLSNRPLDWLRIGLLGV